ncbi:TetR/AcrR family transcriptional regulator [Arthrobacter sp. NPDC090010]|uniref:TetR/AcrR family transcriptional regulator n=1 Tax=Arthrobacter sp. NPDC090010 TaxID=3363942 RepID=UPI003810FA51
MISGAEDRANRRRRGTRPSGDDREAALFETLERLLQEQSFDEVTIADLAEGAGLSRPSFYFYFASKEEVLVALLKRLVAQAEEAGMAAHRRLAGRPGPHWRELIAAHHSVYLQRRNIVLAGLQAQCRYPEARRVMEELREYRIQRTIQTIEKERGGRTLASGLSARQAAVALIAMNEEVLHAALRKDRMALPDEESITVLAALWTQVVDS